MGSMSRFSAIEKVLSVFENEIYDYFSDIIGLTIGELDEDSMEVGYWVSAYVPVIGSDKLDGLEVHFRWATEEEIYAGKLIEDISVSDFNYYVAGRKICSISTHCSDRDDEAYLCAEIEGNNLLEIPLGFNPEMLEFYGHFEYILTAEKRKWFVDNYASIII